MFTKKIIIHTGLEYRIVRVLLVPASKTLNMSCLNFPKCKEQLRLWVAMEDKWLP